MVGICNARSWTGRRCILTHDDDVHQAEDGRRWRGNADAVADGGAAMVPCDVRAAFLAYVETVTYHHGDARSRDAQIAWGRVINALGIHCGVTWLWNETWPWYWAGEWPTAWDEGGAYHDVLPEGIDYQCHRNRWRGRPWGCAVERPWEF